MAYQVKLVGGRRLRRAMRDAGLDLRELKETNRRVAGIVASEGKSSAPVVSGRLAADVRPTASQTSATVRAGRKSLPYAGAIHWGWPKRGIAANPWLSEAAQRTEPTWQDVYMSFINKTIDQIEGASINE